MTIIAWLQTLLVLVFLGLTGLSFGLWRQRGGRPALLLFGVFGLLALVFVLARISPTTAGVFGRPGRDVTVLSLLWVPWLLAAFAWSFDGRLPRWLKLTTVPLIAISAWKLVLPPLPVPGQPRIGIFLGFTVAFIAAWTGLTLLACYRLWRAGDQQLLVRARMRTMAAGALTLNLALLASGWVHPERSSGVYLAIVLLSLASAALFVLGFASPQFLRDWWRRRAYTGWHQMQTDLIAATTPAEVGQAVVPLLAEVVGGGVAVLSRSASVLAAQGFDAAELDRMRTRIAAGELPADGKHVFTAENCWLVLRPSAHGPLFGRHEVELIEGFTLQIRLALERAELHEANLRARMDLERSNRDTEDLLIGLGHDLRSPAMTIAGYTDLLHADPDAPDRDQLLAGLSESARYLSRLVDALLDLSSVGRRGITSGDVDLDALLQRTSARLTAAHPALRVVIPRPLPHVLGIALRLEQLFDNLLLNAVKHGGRDPITVTITWSPTRTGVCLRLGDDGMGIADADRDALFIPFRRGSNTTTEGNGVGLGLARRIIEAVGGTIRLVDDDRGTEGASFEIELLAASEPAPARSATT